MLLQIDREREGEQVDRALLKNVLGIFVEIGMSSMDAYEHDFEVALLADTAEFYSRKASTWIVDDSCPDYMRKAEECLRKEKERVGHYLHQSSETKLLEVRAFDASARTMEWHARGFWNCRIYPGTSIW